MLTTLETDTYHVYNHNVLQNLCRVSWKYCNSLYHNPKTQYSHLNDGEFSTIYSKSMLSGLYWGLIERIVMSIAEKQDPGGGRL